MSRYGRKEILPVLWGTPEGAGTILWKMWKENYTY